MPELQLHITCVISGSKTNGEIAVFEETTEPGAGPPLHLHHEQMEIFHVIEGQYRFFVGEAVIDLGPGGSAVVPRNVAHRFENIGDTTAKLHFDLLPALNSEEGFRRMMGDGLPIDDLPAFFQEYGMTLVE